MVTKNGKIVPVIMNSTVELDENGNGITNRFTCVDISELKQVQEELESQKKDLERANHDLEQFVSICSHDLQEPLSTIKFGSDILGKIYSDKLDQKGKDYIQYIDEASDRLSAQIKALLEHSRIGRNTKKKMVDTRELVEVVRYDLTKRIKDTNAKVHIGSLPKLMVYEVEMRLLFQNLLSISSFSFSIIIIFLRFFFCIHNIWRYRFSFRQSITSKFKLSKNYCRNNNSIFFTTIIGLN